MRELTEDFARSVLPGGADAGWRISEPLGSMGTTRIARSYAETLVVKLIDVPDIVVRLAELGVTPPVVEVGEGYLLQAYAEGRHPDHAWFAGNLEPWTGLLRRYLDDEPLAALVAQAPCRERLSVASAVELLGEPDGTWHPVCAEYFPRWREQALQVRDFGVRPTHVDPHWNNYVVTPDGPTLLDWDQIDLSDIVRDIGYQAWGFLPRGLWSDFATRLGLEPTAELTDAIFWWAAFKVLRNALWVGDDFHPMLFSRAVRRLAWVG